MVQINPHQYKAFIFDMDGTMVDNMMVHHHAWQQQLAAMGLVMTIEEIMEKVHGVNVEIIQRLFGTKYSLQEAEDHARQKEARYRALFADSLQLIAGLPEFMKQTKSYGIPMAVGSAAPPENVDFVLDNLGIRSWFEAVLHSKDVEKGKPDPEIYFKIMEALQVGPKETLIFEDSVVGATSAENAGCEVLVVTTTHQPEEFSGLDNVVGFIHDFTEVSIQ